MSNREFQTARLTRRSVITGVVGSAAAAILAACGAATPAGTSTSAVSTVASAATSVAPTTNAAAATVTPTVAAAATSAAPTVNAAISTVASVATSAAPTVNAAAASAAPTISAAATTVTGTVTSSTAAIPLPDLSKFKGQTLQMVSKTEYFKGSETALDMTLQDFATKTGVKIENNRLNEDMAAVVAKIDQAVKAGNPPDLIYFDRFYSQFVQLDDLIDLTDVVQQAQTAYGPVEDGTVINSKINGKYFCLPYFANANGFFARQDWLAEKGIKPTDVKTFENLRDVALQISDPSKNRFGWGFSVNAGGDGAADINMVVYAYGGAYTSDDGQKVVFNSPESVQAITFLADIYTDPKYKNMLPTGIQSWTDSSNNEQWSAGQVGFTQNAYTLYAQSFSTMNPVYKQTAILPGFVGPATDQVINSPGTGYLAIPKGAKNVDFAKALALYLVGGPAFLSAAKPSLGLIMPTYKNLWGSDPFYMSGDPSFPALQQIIEAKLPVPTKTNYHFPQGPSPIYELAINSQHITADMMGDIIQKGTKPAEAVKAAHDRLVQSANQLGIKQ